ncbi:MAG: family lipase [Segetibacter sp.]|nr:family lipase [Segetibacter sp.]
MTKQIVFCSIVMAMILFTSCGDSGQTATNKNNKVEKKSPEKGTERVQTILFFGNSLTAGYGLEPSEAFPALLQQKIDSAGLKYKTVNAGVSGETSAGGNSRIDWILKQPLDIFVLELGANDGLRGIPVAETKKNLQSIIDKVKAKYPQAKLLLAGMQVPPNIGQQYATNFRNMFPELATKNNMQLVPFLLEGVGGLRELNQGDAIHPTAAGQKIVANNVWAVLQPLLQQ